MMKVALFSDSFHPGRDGVSTYLLYMKEELKRQGHEVSMFVPKGIKPIHDKDIYTFLSVPFPIYNNYSIPVFPYVNAHRIVGKIKPDVIHIHTPFAMGTAGFFAGRSKNIPIVGTFHTSFVNMSESFNTILVNRFTVNLAWWYNMGIYWRCNRLIVPSTSIKRDLLKFATKKFKNDPIIIPNGIDYSRFRNSYAAVDIRSVMKIPADKKIILYIGRLTRDKGVYTILNVAKSIKRKEFYFVVCGEGPEYNHLKKATRNMDNILFYGYLPEKYKYLLLKESSVFILPSSADVFPIAVLEAMAAGTPVLVSNKGGNIDVIGNMERGLAFESGNEWDLVSKLEYILDNSDRMNVVEGRAENYVATVANITNNVKNIVNVYEEVISENKA